MKQIPRRNPLVPADIAVQVQEWKILGKPRQGGIDWNLASWAKEFPEHQEFLTELKKKNLGLLDRNTVHAGSTKPNFSIQSVNSAQLSPAPMRLLQFLTS